MLSDLTPREEKSLNEIAEKIRTLREFLNKYDLPADTSRLDGWFNFLNLTKTILGNFNNDVSFIATLLAKRYLASKYAGLHFDAAAKAQGTPGIDISVQTEDGLRIAAEVKTVEPYGANDFGSQQRASFLKDFAKLAGATANHKYLFLTEPRAFEIIQAKYPDRLAGVTVVCLTDGKELVA